jgi:hypothetical protein
MMGNYQVRFRGRGRGQSLRDLGMGCPEVGHVSVFELASIRLMHGALGIERDLHWRPDKPLSAYVRMALAAGRILT